MKCSLGDCNHSRATTTYNDNTIVKHCPDCGLTSTEHTKPMDNKSSQEAIDEVERIMEGES